MSEELHPRARNLRAASDTEKRLVRFLLEGHPRQAELLQQLDLVPVSDMSDGGMGSIRFVLGSDENRILGAAAGEAEWEDADRVPVTAVLNLDANGNLYELDIWKVDFTPLLRYPDEAQLQRILTT